MDRQAHNQRPFASFLLRGPPVVNGAFAADTKRRQRDQRSSVEPHTAYATASVTVHPGNRRVLVFQK